MKETSHTSLLTLAALAAAGGVSGAVLPAAALGVGMLVASPVIGVMTARKVTKGQPLRSRIGKALVGGTLSFFAFSVPAALTVPQTHSRVANIPAEKPVAKVAPTPAEPTLTPEQEFAKAMEAEASAAYDRLHSGAAAPSNDTYRDFLSRQQQRKADLEYCAKNRTDWSCTDGQYAGQY